MDKIFYRYIARSFWAPFAFGLAVFCLLLIFGSLFDNLNFFMKSGAGAGLFAQYILYQAPYFMVKMTPMATLLAVLSALGGMISRGEWKAGLAGGWKPFQMIKPLLVCSALTGAGQLLLQETVAPDFYLRSEYIFEGKLRARGDWRQVVKKDVSFSAGGEAFVTARRFDGQRRVMEGVILNIYKEGRLFLEVNARLASWREGVKRWIFSDGVLLKFSGDAAPSMERFALWDSGVSVPPGDMVLEKLVPDGVSSAEVLQRLRRLRLVGAPSTAERTLLWVKLAAPLANPVMALIGAAMVLLLRKNNSFLSFGLAVGVGFFFWAVIIMSQEAGKAELLPPLAAGLAPCLLFGLASVFGLKRARGF
ncbi:MAG TPA: LptF/LptG family permease [Elusimicrobiales bacterium]|nr:LptF/LptG family permease [Elusimicrobiales bacterium]